MKNIQNSILRTLEYHAKFDYPLTAREAYKYLITTKRVSQKRIEEKLEKLLNLRKIVREGKFYWPNPPVRRTGHAANCVCRRAGETSLANWRRQRAKYSQSKLKIARKAGKLLFLIPGIRMVAITGSLAMENCKENEDIDLMIVTKRDWLWVIRPVVILAVGMFFRLRRANLANSANLPNLANLICLNLWLDESALEMPKEKQNLRTAHELAQMKPIVNKNFIYERMMGENKWMKNYLANFYPKTRLPPFSASRRIRVNWFVMTKLNSLMFRLQLAYMRPKMTTEYVDLRRAFFHPQKSDKPLLSSAG